METRDGFIIGVYNYCDRWCERCRLATRCHIHVDEQLERQGLGEATCSSGAPGLSLGAVAVRAVHEGGVGFDEADAAPADPNDAPPRPVLTGAARALDTRARQLATALLGWRVPAETPADPKAAEALRVIGHFGYFLGPKIHRALIGLTDTGHPFARADADGSAKAALLALDELEAASLRIAEAGLVGVQEAGPVLREIADVKVDTERLFPRARAFVRPGFDEPEAVAMLEWGERG